MKAFGTGFRAAAAVLGAALVAAAPDGRASTRSDWDFVVRLDGQEIGTHRFSVEPAPAGEVSVTSEARFAVKLRGWTAYRYQHVARERWRGNCLAALEASTDDGGKVIQVQGRRTPDGFRVEVADARRPDASASSGENCLMSFAYWNAALFSQRKLLDPGSGRLESVRIRPVQATELAGAPGGSAARGWRIEGLPAPIDVWYEGDQWVGLDTVVGGSRRLSYRLR